MVVDCRQEKLEQLAARFDRKAGMRETWLSENQRLVSQVHSHESLTLFAYSSMQSRVCETVEHLSVGLPVSNNCSHGMRRLCH